MKQQNKFVTYPGADILKSHPERKIALSVWDHFREIHEILCTKYNVNVFFSYPSLVVSLGLELSESQLQSECTLDPRSRAEMSTVLQVTYCQMIRIFSILIVNFRHIPGCANKNTEAVQTKERGIELAVAWGMAMLHT
jgi:hypothetical protein